MSDYITILRCARNLRLAKLIRQDRIIDYDSTRTFDAWTVPVEGLDDLHKLVTRLIDAPRLCVVRGELIHGPKANGVRRLVYKDSETGDEPTLRDVPRRWVALDIEGVQRHDHIPAEDLPACTRHAVQRLPKAFHNTACIAQATAGHGLKPDLRLRLWFWLSRPTGGMELKRWLKGSPADPSVFSAAQIIFTAAPVFDNCEDHLPQRVVSMSGVRTSVEVPSPEALAPPPSPAPRPLPAPSESGAAKYVWAVLRNAKARVSGAPINSRHPTCLREARSLARLVQVGLLTSSQVTTAMGEALQEAGKTKEEGEAIAAWGLAHPVATALPGGVL